MTVINEHDGKARSDEEEERRRYRRFLGPGVDYTRSSFQDFARDPSAFI